MYGCLYPNRDSSHAVTFKLVHRPQNDPLIHDESAPAMVLAPAANTSKTGKSATTLDDLASQLGSDAEEIRANEGVAADYGIYYDDTEYDYMQHLREPGSLGAGVVSMGANLKKQPGKDQLEAKKLDEALREMDLRDKSERLLEGDILPSKDLQRLTYQSQQNVPDAIAGFQPDMDPRLREVLEALEDDAYVDNDDDKVFSTLANDARELNTHDFEESEDIFWDDGDGWESGTTEKPPKPPSTSNNNIMEAREVPTQYTTETDEVEDRVPELARVLNTASKSESTPADQNPDWLSDFKKFKQDQESASSRALAGAGPSRAQRRNHMMHTSHCHEGLSSITASWTKRTGRRKRAKDALTNPSMYSMTSSVLSRTEHQRILDDRFESTKGRWESEIDDRATRMTGASSTVTTAPREDFDTIVEEFLTQCSHGRKRGSAGRRRGQGKNAATSSGVAELDEIRNGLGPARVASAAPGST